MKWVYDINRPQILSLNDSHGGHLINLETKICNFNEWLVDVSMKREFLLFLLMPISKNKQKLKQNLKALIPH